MRMQRLGKGNDTDCYDYELDNNFNYYRLRSDYINDFYQDKMRHICQVDRGLFMSHSLLRKDSLFTGNDRLISCYNTEYNQQIYSIKQNCEQICKAECNSKYYKIEIERNDYDDLRDWTEIKHNEYPDIFVQYIPKLNLVGFLCNFGGLLGMWLGLSLFSIYAEIFNQITKFPYQKYFNYLHVDSLFEKMKYNLFHFITRHNCASLKWKKRYYLTCFKIIKKKLNYVL